MGSDMSAGIPIFHVYCDESCTQHRFTTIGSVFCSETHVQRITGFLEEVIEKHGGSSELKWSKLKRLNLPMYTEVVDLFCKFRTMNWIHYYCLVVYNSQMDHKTYNDGDKEIGFNKMIFFHLLNYARKYRSFAFNVYLDDRTTVHTPEKTRMMLNGRVAREMPRRPARYRVCQFRLSHEVRLIQLADIFTGAIGSAMSGQHFRWDAASHKGALIRHIEAGCRHPSLSVKTGIRFDGFEIWHFQFNAGKASQTPRR
jgi:hypothetical protein